MLLYRRLSDQLRVFAILLVVTSLNETVSYLLAVYQKWETRYIIYHVFNMIQAILFTTYFIYTIKPRHPRIAIMTGVIFWTLTGVLNIAFLQPLHTLNNNMLMVESFCFITMSLYVVYQLIRQDDFGNFIRQQNFHVAVLCLLLWSSSFFFWAFVRVLYRGQWQYVRIAIYAQGSVNILFYLGTISLLLFHSKKIRRYEHR